MVCHKHPIIQETMLNDLHVIYTLITHKQNPAHFVVWPSKVMCIAKFVLLLYVPSLWGLTMTEWDIYKAPSDLVHHCHPVVYFSLC